MTPSSGSISARSKNVLSFVVPFIFIGLLSASLEETGWTGFAWPRMSLEGSVLGAALTLGIVHSVWHFWSDFLANFGTMGGSY